MYSETLLERHLTWFILEPMRKCILKTIHSSCIHEYFYNLLSYNYVCAKSTPTVNVMITQPFPLGLSLFVTYWENREITYVTVDLLFHLCAKVNSRYCIIQKCHSRMSPSVIVHVILAPHTTSLLIKTYSTVFHTVIQNCIVYNDDYCVMFPYDLPPTRYFMIHVKNQDLLIGLYPLWNLAIILNG